LSQVEKHLSIKFTAIYRFWFDTVDNFAPQLLDLLHKLRPQLVQIHFSQILQLVFFSEWSDHGAAVTLFEKALK
jgi:hypothetical protein